MTNEEIKNKVTAIIVDQLSVDANEVQPEAHLQNDLGADSIDSAELIMEFEQEFSIDIPEEQAEKIQTVGDTLKYLENNIKK